MKRSTFACLNILFTTGLVWAKTLTYNDADVVNMRELGIPADERETHVLRTDGDVVYGATSGDQCHVFRFDPAPKTLDVLATIPGPNTVLRGMVLDTDAIYVGTMLTKRQLWLKVREADPTFDPEDANLLPIRDTYHTGRLYRIRGVKGDSARLEDLGVPVEAQGIHTMAIDTARGLIYGVTYPNGRFFTYDIKNGHARDTAFGHTYATVSNHRVGIVEVQRELADLVPGEGEWNNRLVPRAMHVIADGSLFTSGWDGQLLKYNPSAEDIQRRFSAVGYIPSVPGRQYWNRLDAVTERQGKLYMGTSDGYIVRFDPATRDFENLGKPIRAVEVMGMVFSPLDGRLYGVSGGGLEGMSRFWCCDVEKGTFEVDYPALPVFPNRRRVGDLVCTKDGTLVISEASRVGNLWVLNPGEPKEWQKGGVLPDKSPQEGRYQPAPEGRFRGHKKLEVDVYPIPCALHGGSGYTAIQADINGRIYVGTAYYGLTARLLQLDPDTARWRSIFRSDELTGQYGRGQGIPGKIHTKLRLGADGKIYGAMKQGYEFHYTIRPDVGEAPEGRRGSQYTCYFFSYDPATDIAEDLGPGWPQEGITAFAVDTDRGYVYGGTVPGVFFLVYNMATRRVWNAGAIAHGHPTRYMPIEPGTGKVYHPGEVTPGGNAFMTVWEPETFRLRDVEIIAEEGFEYRHSYATCCGPAGTNKIYGGSGDFLFEMDLDDRKDGRFHARPVCAVGVEGDAQHTGLSAIECGPDGRIYWASAGGRNIPMALFAWDPKTETKTYLGSCALGGEWIRWSSCQGLCLDRQGNLALHVLYAELSEEQKRRWKVPDDFFYEDIAQKAHFLGYPAHDEGTYYSVFYVKNAVAIN
ncbi:MAG TPA: PQQ-like beta-propeller repeat protein [Candidatus Hydrogenedentes bacterium]|nr:PQQ-like beta-propeller repeat protein [Candidatus Hydrogenedentota bacterium]